MKQRRREERREKKKTKGRDAIKEKEEGESEKDVRVAKSAK